MRAVIGTVISSKPVTLEGAAAALSNFAAVATGSRPELAVFSVRASRAFAELLAFHRSLRSPHPASAGDLHSTRNRADAAQACGGIGIADKSLSLGANWVPGLENGAGSGVEREIDMKRKRIKERGEAAVKNVSDERDGKRKSRKERVEAVEEIRSREVELAVRREEPEEKNDGVADNVALGIDNERDGKRKMGKERVDAAEGNLSREVELAVRREEPEEKNVGVADNVASGIDNERDGKKKKRKEKVEAAEGKRSREVELAVRREEPAEMNAGVDGNVALSIDKERDGKIKKRKEKGRDVELVMNATNRLEDDAVHERRYESAIDNGVLPKIVNAAVDNGVVPGIVNEGSGKKKKKKRSRDAELAEKCEDPGMNAVSRIEGVDDDRDGKRATLKERAALEEVSMGIVQPEVKVEKEEFGEERSEERKKKRRRSEKNKNREDDLKVNDSVVQVEVKLEKEEFGTEGGSEERRNREGKVNVDGGGKKRKHSDDKKEEGGLEGQREPHNRSVELGDQSEQHHKKKRRKRE